MKKLFVILSLVFCVSGWGQSEDYSYLREFRPVVDRLNLNMLRSGVSKAIEILDYVATKHYTPQLRQNADTLIDLLRTAQLKEPIGQKAFNRCSDGTAAFVNSLFPNVIHLCNIAIESADDVAKTAQMFIHEAVHLAKDSDECSATKFELKIMKRSKEGIQFYNSYVSGCRININNL